MMPRANTGSAVSALSGLSGWFTTDEADACYAELAELRKQVERRLSRLSKGIQYTAQSLLDSTKDNSKSCATKPKNWKVLSNNKPRTPRRPRV